MLLVGACAISSAPTGAHWVGSGERTIQVRLDATAQDPGFVWAFTEGARAWSDDSPWVQFVVAPGTCQPGENCIDVYRQPGVAGRTYYGWNSDLEMYGRAASIYLDSAPWDPWVLINASCHELGHALGLAHGTVEGPCQAGRPTAWDLALIAQAYN